MGRKVVGFLSSRLREEREHSIDVVYLEHVNHQLVFIGDA